MANYPGERPAGSHCARPRKQRMFARREDAEEFLMEARREFFQKGRVELGCDREITGHIRTMTFANGNAFAKDRAIKRRLSMTR